MDTVTAEAELNRFLDRQAGKVKEDRAGQEAANRQEAEMRKAEVRRRYVSNFAVRRASGQDLQPSLAAQQADQEARIQRPPGFYSDGQLLPQKPQPRRQIGRRSV